MKINKHPDEIAWDKWLESDEGKKCTDGAGVFTDYLRNRLYRAFNAGIKHGKELGRAEKIVEEFNAKQ